MNKSRFSFPCVTVEQAEAFKFEEPETWTKSILVNGIADALARVRPLNRKSIAAYLGMEPLDVNYGLRALTGLSLPDFMIEWRKLRFKRILREEPGIKSRDMAVRLGFASQGALWTFLTNHQLIKPLANQGWSCGKYQRLRKEAEMTARDNINAEYHRRKWEELTKNSK